jgi:hypothetical protein
MNREKLRQELFQPTQFGERLTPKGKRWLGWFLLVSSVLFRLVFSSPLDIFGIAGGIVLLWIGYRSKAKL